MVVVEVVMVEAVLVDGVEVNTVLTPGAVTAPREIILETTSK